MNLFKILSLACALIVFASIDKAKSEAGQMFKDWQASCDNSGNCKATAYDRGPNDTSISYRLELARKRGRNTFWTVSFIIIGDAPRAFEPFHISVDFEEPLTLQADEDFRKGIEANAYDISAIAPANTLMRLFASGNETIFNYLNSRGQETAARFSLKGFQATLLWIDDRQGRLNSPRTTGLASAATAQNNTQNPGTFTSGNTTVLAPDKLPPAIAKIHFTDGECDTNERVPLANFGFETARIDKDNTLFLVPCYAAAYNVVYRTYLTSTSPPTPRQLLFAQYSDELGWTGTGELMNLSYDAKTKSLLALSKSRGLGDCGSSARYQWNAYAFKMIEYRYWSACDGTRLPKDWPVIYRAPK